MTPHEALAEGRLAEALEIQGRMVAANPDDHAASRLLVDLLAFAGRLDEALELLAHIRTDDPEWLEVKCSLRGLFRAVRARLAGVPAPHFFPPADHAIHRWSAIESLRSGHPERAIDHIDRADAVSPPVRGFLDGREFEGLHDADDRFASVLEAFREGEYIWLAWEALRKVALGPAVVMLDQLFRPATITFRDGAEFPAHLPLVYPSSHEHNGVFALGTETDHICPDGGPMRCIGGKLLLVGDGTEVLLAELRMIEIR